MAPVLAECTKFRGWDEEARILGEEEKDPVMMEGGGGDVRWVLQHTYTSGEAIEAIVTRAVQ
jgi:hypothetical protein